MPFREFSLAHRDELAGIIAQRSVNTNEVRRCGCLLPALAFAALHANATQVHLIDIGCSAGLNLFADKYKIDFGPYGGSGPNNSSVQFRTDIRQGRLSLAPIPHIQMRTGIDPDPIDLNDPQDVTWFKSLVWPDHLERFERLEAAVGIAQEQSSDITKGYANDVLPDLIRSSPDDLLIVIQHSFVLNQFTPEDREILESLLIQSSKHRPIARIGMEWDQTHAVLSQTHYENGQSEQTHLGIADAHGAWMTWHK